MLLYVNNMHHAHHGVNTQVDTTHAASEAHAAEKHFGHHNQNKRWLTQFSKIMKPVQMRHF
jgi:hypothetical protein